MLQAGEFICNLHLPDKMKTSFNQVHTYEAEKIKQKITIFCGKTGDFVNIYVLFMILT